MKLENPTLEEIEAAIESTPDLCHLSVTLCNRPSGSDYERNLTLAMLCTALQRKPVDDRPEHKHWHIHECTIYGSSEVEEAYARLMSEPID